MAKLNLVLFCLLFCFTIVFITIGTCSYSSDTSMFGPEKLHVLHSYCMANEDLPDIRLLGIIDYYCKQPRVNCSVILPGGECFQPNNIYAHACVVLDLYRFSSDKCPFDVGHIQFVDRPYGACPYYPPDPPKTVP